MHRRHELRAGDRRLGAVELRRPRRGLAPAHDAAYAWSLDRLHGPEGRSATLRAAKRAVERAFEHDDAPRAAATVDPDEVRRWAGPWTDGRRIPFMCGPPSLTTVDEVDRVVRRAAWRGEGQWGCYAALSQAEQESYGGGFSIPGYG